MAHLLLEKIRIIDGGLPFIIAEIGHNHQGNIELCKSMISKAAKCGAHAVKLQKRDNKTLFIKNLYNMPYENVNSFGKTYGEHREKLELSLSEWKILIEYAKGKNIFLFATPFDEKSLDFLENLEMPFYKIQSGDISNLYFIDLICKTKKPIILSTGASTIWEIEKAVELIQHHGNPFAILHCTSLYPTRATEIVLNTIKEFKSKFPGNIIGFSSHYDGIVAAVAAYIEGAMIIEQHFTLSHTLKGTDHALSLQPDGLTELCHYIHEIYKMRLKKQKDIEQIQREKKAIIKLSKSLYAKGFLKKDEILSFNNVCCKSPYNDDGLPIQTLFKNNKKLVLKKDHNEEELITLKSI